jgi:hypothetical protein
VVALVAIPAMRYLAYRKIAIAEKDRKSRATRRRNGGGDVRLAIIRGGYQSCRSMACRRVVD